MEKKMKGAGKEKRERDRKRNRDLRWVEKKYGKKRKFGDLEWKKEIVESKKSKPYRKSTRSQTDVALSIAKGLFDSKGENIVFSPLSLQVVLIMIAAGSDGSTLDELLSFLGSNSTYRLNSFASKLISTVLSNASSTGGPCLRFANGVWAEQSLHVNHSFKQIMNTDYKATLASVDFRTKALQVAREVNSWVEKETKGLIRDLLSPGSVDGLTRLIFVNALYFKGQWSEKFKASMTKDKKFYLLNRTSVKVPFIVSKEKQLIRVFEDFKVLGLPYKHGKDRHKFSMYIFLPHAKDGLSDLVELVTSNSGFLESNLPNKKVEVGDLRIPKFKFSFEFEASLILKKLGVVLPFSYHADLTKMVDSPNDRDLHVSHIFHKSFIELNEEGTEAAAASCAKMSKRKCMRTWPTRIDFVADHPFMFLIREDSSGTVLFIGQVLNPLAG